MRRLDGRGAGGRLPDDVEAFGGEKRPRRRTKRRMVVDDQHAGHVSIVAGFMRVASTASNTLFAQERPWCFGGAPTVLVWCATVAQSQFDREGSDQ